MTHPLVAQLRFTRGEFHRGLEGLSAPDAEGCLEPMNSIAWMVGHMANHEHAYWLRFAQGADRDPELSAVSSGKPATTPRYPTMLAAWLRVTAAADPYLDSLTSDDLARHLEGRGRPAAENIGTMLQRLIYHYWFHLGEVLAVRQLLGHRGLPEFVGALGTQAPHAAGGYAGDPGP